MKHTYYFLYPGAFKPFHDGHYSLLKKYINLLNTNIENGIIILLVSNSSRNGIKHEAIDTFMTKIADNLHVKLLYVNNPVAACYKLVGENANNNFEDKFTMISSNKDYDITRSIDFYKAYTIGGKYYDGITRTFNDTPINIQPTYFKNTNTPVCASLLRYFIAINDFNSFKQGYINMLNDNIIDMYMLKLFFNELKKYIQWTDKLTDKIKSEYHDFIKNK